MNKPTPSDKTSKNSTPKGSSNHLDNLSLLRQVLKKLTGTQLAWLIALGIIAYVVLRIMETK